MLELVNPSRQAVCALLLAAAAPASAFAQCPDGTPPPCAPRPPRVAAPAPTSVAILYLDNLSRDTADAYLADGLTEELTSRIGAIERLRVTGRSVARRAQQASGGDVAALGRMLGVRYLVEGSVRRSGSRVRVSVRLLRAADGVRVWGEDYDRTVTDLLDLQEDLAREVATNVAGRLLPAERVAIAARPTSDPVAYNEYLRGSYLVTRRTAAALQQAAAAFEAAARRDPRFAAAEARRAYAYGLAYAYGADWAPPESLAAWGARAAERAIRLDSTVSDSWMAQGITRLWFVPRGVRGASEAYGRATALDPRNAEAHHAHGVALSWLGEDSAAIASFRRALELDPARAVTLLDLAEVLALEQHDAEARRLLDSAIALDPAQARPYVSRAFLRLSAADLVGARQDAETGLRLSPRGVRPSALSALAAVNAAAGDTARARSIVALIEAEAWGAADAARALLALGEPDSALAVLERAPAAALLWYTLRFPEFDRIRSHPRFRRIVAAAHP